jgi:HPt (histidine-containing phosphotransfer) domain-containing protein
MTRPATLAAAAKHVFTVCGLVTEDWKRAGARPAARWSGDELTDADTSDESAPDIVDWAHFEKSRADLGPGFIRILSYFREDGAKSVAAIEQAMHAENATDLVIPAHTLKGEARQFGAEPLAAVAELIESTARMCVETHRFPDELVRDVVELRKLFQQTVDLFEKATNPLVTRARPSAFGRKASNQDFGRI